MKRRPRIKHWPAPLVGVGILLLVSCGFGQDRPTVGPKPQSVQDVHVPKPPGVTVEPWVQGLEVAWALVFLPDGRALVSERPGRIRLIEDGKLRPQPYASITVDRSAEGGLMGLAVHPDFPEQPYVYAMHTYRDGRRRAGRVIRLRHDGDSAKIDKTIIDNIPAQQVHNGGRIAFGPDGMLYITTGDIWQAEIAQDPESLGGKILRVTPDGEIPADNPFPGSPVWTLGHRNPQGLAWDPETGALFSSEHGPSGEYGLSGMDIVNVIKKGRNYGWPRVWGKAGDERYEDPLVMWDRATPPAGMAFFNGDLFLATLGSEALIRIQVRQAGEGYEVTGIERWFVDDRNRSTYGRLRDAVTGPDGHLYVLTSNRDGRGRPRSGDDRILRITISE